MSLSTFILNFDLDVDDDDDDADADADAEWVTQILHHYQAHFRHQTQSSSRSEALTKSTSPWHCAWSFHNISRRNGS